MLSPTGVYSHQTQKDGIIECALHLHAIDPALSVRAKTSQVSWDEKG
jgi:hypothetical protein